MTPDIAASARAHAALREQSHSHAAVEQASRAVEATLQEWARPRPPAVSAAAAAAAAEEEEIATAHRTVRLLRLGSASRRALVWRLMESLPAAPSAAEWQRQGRAEQLGALFVSRSAVLLALAQVHANALRVAESAAAVSTLQALETAAAHLHSQAVASGPSVHDAGCGAAATPGDKAVYAAVRRTARWSQLREAEEAEAVNAELASRQQQLEVSRAAAEGSLGRW